MNKPASKTCTGLGIASVPMQEWGEVYRPETAFANGTIFPDLHMPYYPPQARNYNNAMPCDRGRCR